jgi:cytochrome c oxidase subunit 2
MRIEVFLDQAETPVQVLIPPETFELDTETLSDGPHELRFTAIDEAGTTSVRTVSFQVQNGPAIAVHGVLDGDTLSGKIPILANAYGTRFGDEFEPLRMETPAPVPTWAWVLFLIIIAWGAGYLALEFVNHIQTVLPESSVSSATPSVPSSTAVQATQEAGSTEWRTLGKQVYGNNCVSCHQADGTGLPGVFPPLVDNPAVIDNDSTEHINAILHGVSGKVIDGVSYASPMPPFGTLLNDKEIAAVVNHERSNWGNNAPLLNAEDVAARR